MLRAVTYVGELRERARRIGEFPHAGPPRPQWGEGIRIAVHGNYLIIYRVRDETVQVLRVLHGARDLDALFEAEPLPD
jgi:toxin ParE1/3/4